MAHIREVFREAVVASVTGLETTGSKVFSNRVDAYDNLPCLNVTTLDEYLRDDLGSMAGIAEQVRELRVVVEGRAKAPALDAPDDELDTIADEVEEAVLNDTDLNSLAFGLSLESTTFAYDREGANPVGKVELVFSLLYETDGRNPSETI